MLSTSDLDEIERATQTAASSSSATGPPPVRLWAISDIHTDNEANAEWVRRLSTTAYRRDGLIVAGDVSDSTEVLRATLQNLVRRFGRVWFCPGNHDLWLSAADEGDSMDKLRRILDLCAEEGVQTGPGTLEGPGAAIVRVWPLLAWHHQSFDTEPDLQGWAIPAAEDTMVDYRACRFDGLSQLDESVAAAVDKLNDAHEAPPRVGGAAAARAPLVTFSHFLPRPELLIEKRFLLCPPLPKAAGS